MTRREFLGATAVGTAALAAVAAPAFDLAAARRTLAGHKLAKIEARRLQDRYLQHVGRNRSGGSAGNGGAYQIRILTTDQGVSGWGMSWVPDDRVRRFEGMRIGDLIDPVTGVPEDGHDILELPLYDLMGNILGSPAYVLMGAAGPRDVPIYCGSIYFEDLDSPKGIDYLLDCCQKAYDVGYRDFKLKMGRGFKFMPHDEGLQRDVDVVRAVRKRFPGSRILVDANNGYTVDDACRFVKETAECDLYWIEEPFLEEREGLLRLREQMEKVGCKALIADGEGATERPAAPGAYGGYPQKQIDLLYALAAEKLVNVFVMDLGTTGYTRWRRIMPELKKAGVLASPHLWMWTPRPYYAAQLAGGVGNVCIIEGIPGKPDGADFSAYTFVDGKLHLPDAPGFGLKLT